MAGAIEEVALERKQSPTEADWERMREIERKDQPSMGEKAFVRRITQRMKGVPETVRTWVQALRIGGLALVGIPGELMVELGLQIKKRSPFEQTSVLELANDYIGYIPTRRAFEEGGYEPEASLFKPGVGEKIVDAAVTLLAGLHGG